MARRWRASSSPISPAFRSASIAICLPGIASRLNLAATSLIRSAPLVITTNWMTTSIRKTTRPTTRLLPTTKCPNVAMIFPASPCSRIKRVEATFNDKRNKVTKRSSEGKVENSIDSLVASTATSVAILIAMLQDSSMSSREVGS